LRFSASAARQLLPQGWLFSQSPNRSDETVTSVRYQETRDAVNNELGEAWCCLQSDRNDTASHALKKRKSKPFVIRQEYHGMAFQQVFSNLMVFYKANQTHWQTVALFSKNLFYDPTVRAIAVDQSFGVWNLAHGSAKSMGEFRYPLSFFNQLPHVSKPQSSVGSFRHMSWNRKPVGNPPNQNSLGPSAENILLEVL